MRAYLPLVSSPVARKRYTSPTRATVRPSAGLRMVGFIRLSLLSLRRQLPDELHRPLNPALQLIVTTTDALRGHHYPTLHRPASDVELLDVRFEQGLVAFFRAEADNQGVLPDAD